MLQKNELYEKLSDERKKLQSDGELPEWLTTMGWQMLKNKSYLYKTNSLKVTFERVAKTAIKHLKEEHKEYYQKRFYEVLWDGHLALSTPAYNLGTPKGFPVSCTGNTIDDSVFGFYDSIAEVANLTKEYFGTSSYIGDIRSRGSKISRGGTASGVVPVFKSHVQVMDDITQGTARRGSWGGYIDLMHGDFDELVDEIMAEPEGYNIGVNYYDADLIRISNGDQETIRRFQKHMKLRAIFGKGYFYFVDRTHRKQPPMYEKHGLRSLASNLCSEITLHADKDHSFTCILSSMNLQKYDEWKDTDAVQVATVLLDCIVSELLELIDAKPEREQGVYAKIRRGTEKSRALGLGVMGFHTYLQDHMIPIESMECVEINNEIFTHIHDESLKASKWMAKEYGEPEWCKGFGVRNTHRTCLPPTMSCVIPSTNIITDNGVKSYVEICDELDVDLDLFLTIEVIDDSGNIHKYKYDDILSVTRKDNIIDVRAVDLMDSDFIGNIKISKVVRKSNIWMHSDVKTITIDNQIINRVYFNGFYTCYKLTFSDGSEFTCTPNHKLMSIDNEWVEASNMNVGFVCNNGLHIVEKRDTGYLPTMDIEVPVWHEYYLENGIKSHNSSQICGTVSQGIEPLLANTFQQELAGGVVLRINPTLLKIMKDRGVLTQELIDEIGKVYDGSVQHVDWLTPLEKQVFKTAYEVDQIALIDLAADRQPKVCQSQSLNLQFKANTPGEVIAKVHLYAMYNKEIKSLYYMRSQSSSKGSDGISSVENLESCESCVA